MKNYTVYKSSGEIVVSGVCEDDAFSYQIAVCIDGTLVELSTDPNSQYMEDGQPVNKPVRPSQEHEFDWATKQWIDPRSISELKEAKWSEIKAAREAAIDADLATPFGTFDSDAKARTNITDSVLLLKSLEDIGEPDSIDFTLADNSVATLNTEQMVQVGLLLGQKVQAAHTRARALRIQKDAAATKEELSAIVW